MLENSWQQEYSQTLGNFGGFFEKCYFYVKTAVASFWVTFGKNGLLFIAASGHTAHVRERLVSNW